MRVPALSPILAAGALLAIAPREAAAEVYRPWCVGYTATISNSCTFVSFEQCMETARGGGGSCMQNPWYLYYGDRQPALASTSERGKRRR
jgi:Protein of unknown function (DUF3551)